MRHGQDTVSLINPLLSLVSVLLLPAVLLLAAGIVLEYGLGGLSSGQLAVLRFLPVLLLGGGMYVAFRFNRLRLYGALGNFLLVYAIIAWFLPQLEGNEAASMLGWLFLLAPINHLATHILPDRGSHPGSHASMLAVAGFEALLVGLTLGIPLDGISGLLNLEFITMLDTSHTGITDIGLFAIGVMLMLSFARLYSLVNSQRATLFVAGFCLALVLAAHAEAPTQLAFATVAALVMVISVFQESWNIAYLDQLTELPGRRALDEALARLEGVYTVAMVDVDHFKKFNDTHGHDVGDQVLRMVATQLRTVRGGGKAYRYGGEEFTLLFPGQKAKDALPFVDELRERIAADSFELRTYDRRTGKSAKPTSRKKSKTLISITVSAGVAQRKNQATAEDVIKKADVALYKAKRNGRNRVEKSR